MVRFVLSFFLKETLKIMIFLSLNNIYTYFLESLEWNKITHIGFNLLGDYQDGKEYHPCLIKKDRNLDELFLHETVHMLLC